MSEDSALPPDPPTTTRHCWLPWVLLAVVMLASLGLTLRDFGRRGYGGARTGQPTATMRTQAPMAARVGGFNIHRGKGDDGVTDLARVARELEGIDVVVLNEVDFASDQGQQLAELRNQDLLPAPTERRWGRDDFGNATVTRLPVDTWSVLPLRHTLGRGWRNVTFAVVRVGDERLTVLGTHLDRGTDRRVQLETVLSLFERLEPPVVLIGDLNTTGEDARLAATLARQDVEDVLGRIAGVAPDEHIDWILLRSGGKLEAIAAELRDSPASDHPVVWVDLCPPEEE